MQRAVEGTTREGRFEDEVVELCLLILDTEFGEVIEVLHFRLDGKLRLSTQVDALNDGHLAIDDELQQVVVVLHVEAVQREFERSQLLGRRRQSPCTTADVASVFLHLILLIRDEVTDLLHFAVDLHLSHLFLGILLHLCHVFELGLPRLAVGNAELTENNAWKPEVQFLVREHTAAADIQHAAHHQLDARLHLTLLRQGFHKQVGLFLVNIRLRQEEVEIQVVNLLHLEDICKLLPRLLGLLIHLVQLHDLTGVAYLALHHRHAEGAAEVTVLEVVLKDAESHLIQGERPAAQLSLGGSREYLVGSQRQRGTALVEEHIRS